MSNAVGKMSHLKSDDGLRGVKDEVCVISVRGADPQLSGDLRK